MNQLYALFMSFVCEYITICDIQSRWIFKLYIVNVSMFDHD